MKRYIPFVAIAVSALSIAACNAPSSETFAPATMSSSEAGFYPLTRSDAAYRACPPAHRAHEWRCNAWVRTDLRPVSIGPGIPLGVGYTPADLESAYGFDSSGGSGRTVVIVDAYGYWAANWDLEQYRMAAGLPPCTISTGCLRVLNQAGSTWPLPSPPPSSLVGWIVEQSLDLDTVSGVCPHCKIVLIEAMNDISLRIAINTAMRFGHVISMSFGGPETFGEPADPGLPRSGYALVASAGDYGGGYNDGGGPQIPCSWAAIICVGGTKLTHPTPNSWKSVVWNNASLWECGGPCGATGSGCSAIVPKPVWQHDRGCSMRSEVDISADAAVTTPYAVYNSTFPGSHWLGVGGTSLAAPMIAAMIALAGNAETRHGAMEIWENHSSLTNVVRGTNVYLAVTGPCAAKARYICVAAPGYNGPTGWGSPKGLSDL